MFRKYCRLGGPSEKKTDRRQPIDIILSLRTPEEKTTLLHGYKNGIIPKAEHISILVAEKDDAATQREVAEVQKQFISKHIESLKEISDIPQKTFMLRSP